MHIRPSIIILENERLLTLKYNYGGTEVFALPGGNLEFGERMEDALKRELVEELGIVVDVVDLKYIAEVHQEKKDTLHMVFLGKILKGVPIINPIETSAEAVAWVSIQDLDSIALYPNIVQDLKKIDSVSSTQFLGEIQQPWY
jgi:8-oxo-dGTP diphosphatase